MKWLTLSDEQRRLTIEQTAQKLGLPQKAVEKDWWVTQTLRALFATPSKEFLIFRGGTSLSKCWNLIERFSEDIDIGLHVAAFGENYSENPTTSSIKRLKKKGCEFTSTTLLEQLKEGFTQIGMPIEKLKISFDEVKPTVPDKDPQSIFVEYSSLFDPNPYLADRVKIEVGVRSGKEPKAIVEIKSFISAALDHKILEENPVQVTVVDAQRTFLEKIFLLHEEFLKAETSSIRTDRMSRHLYDLFMLSKTDISDQALNNEPLYESIVNHRRTYNQLEKVTYEKHAKNEVAFIPPAQVMFAYERDYRTMREQMISGQSPEFNVLMTDLIALQVRIRNLGENPLREESLRAIEGHYIRWWEDNQSTSEGKIFAKAQVKFIAGNKLNIDVRTLIDYSKERYGELFAEDRIEHWNGTIEMETENSGTIFWQQISPNNKNKGVKKFVVHPSHAGISLIGERGFGVENFTTREK